MKGKSKSAKYFQSHPKARKKKNAYNKEYHSSPERRKYRGELVKKNREAGTYGNGDNKDYDHGKKKMIPASTNRAKKNKKGKGVTGKKKKK